MGGSGQPKYAVAMAVSMFWPLRIEPNESNVYSNRTICDLPTLLNNPAIAPRDKIPREWRVREREWRRGDLLKQCVADAEHKQNREVMTIIQDKMKVIEDSLYTN